jgi:LDH2 family malate/lactate/ureidoglycolate dehydrogenase
MAEEKVFKAEELRLFAVETLQKTGVSADHARIISEALVEADLRGVSTHGMAMLPLYIRRLQRQIVNPEPDIKVARESPIHALIDGDNGEGHLVSVKAMEICLDKAKKSSIAMVGVRKSNHFGVAGYYSAMAVKEELIGFSATNTAPSMPPYGGTARTFGNNPFSIAIPAALGFPIVLDIATSNVAFAKLFRAKQMGQKEIPLDWALDEKGRPTGDPEVAYSAALLQGMGGHKGYGLSVAIDVIAGVLTGAGFAKDIPPQSTDSGHFFAAFDPELFMPLTDFKERLARMAAQVRESSLAEGVDRVYLPGERGHLSRGKRLKEGIPLFSYVCEQLNKVGGELGVALPG